LKDLHGDLGMQAVLFERDFFAPEIDVAEITPPQFLHGQIKNMGLETFWHVRFPFYKGSKVQRSGLGTSSKAYSNGTNY